MIITGYQGIGKSTLASKYDNIIDLESSCFWKYDLYDFEKKGDRSRPDDWYVYYCQMAQYLSKQGYIVFVSCHPQVREFLSISDEEVYCAIFPDKSIKDDWLNRLKDRYENSKSDKDLRAYKHALANYDNDIEKLLYECQYSVEYYHDVYIIKDINYDLKEIVDKLINNNR